MGQAVPHSPALLLLAAFSGHDAALGWVRSRAIDTWGPIAGESPVFEFTDTDYYRPTMGDGLRKVFWTFQRPFDPADMAEVKLLTNRWEAEYAATAEHTEPRPLNLDPGYLTLGKLVLASTKDHAHRVYLGRGIYGEVTLFYRHGRWEPREWTFADYRREDYQAFFSRCREALYERKREDAAT